MQHQDTFLHMLKEGRHDKATLHSLYWAAFGFAVIMFAIFYPFFK